MQDRGWIFCRTCREGVVNFERDHEGHETNQCLGCRLWTAHLALNREKMTLPFFKMGVRDGGIGRGLRFPVPSESEAGRAYHSGYQYGAKQ